MSVTTNQKTFHVTFAEQYADMEEYYSLETCITFLDFEVGK